MPDSFMKAVGSVSLPAHFDALDLSITSKSFKRMDGKSYIVVEQSNFLITKASVSITRQESKKWSHLRDFDNNDVVKEYWDGLSKLQTRNILRSRFAIEY